MKKQGVYYLYEGGLEIYDFINYCTFERLILLLTLKICTIHFMQLNLNVIVRVL